MDKQDDPEVADLNDRCSRMRSLLLSEDHSDITFIAENERVPAHTFVLATAGDRIRARLRCIVGKKEIVLRDVSLESLKQLLTYIYTGCLLFSDLELETILGVLKLSHQLGIETLQVALCQYLLDILSEQNACTIYATVGSLDLEHLGAQILHLIDRQADTFLKSDVLTRLPAESLLKIFQRDSFVAEELEIFEAVKRWVAERPHDKDSLKLVEAIRLTLIDDTDILDVVKKSNLVPADHLLDALVWQEKNQKIDAPHRRFLVPGVNLATTDRGAKVLTGEHKENLLEPKVSVAGGVDQVFTSHGIGDPQGITVDLGGRFMINNIVFRLLDKDPPSFSYYVDISTNLKDWCRVIDYSKYCCRSLQTLYFEPRVCRYIRVVGTQSPSNELFRLITIEAAFKQERFELQDGFLFPEGNVASLKMGASVIEGENCHGDRSDRNRMISGDWLDEFGFTQHKIGAGSIIVQLAQPYMIDSIGMLLWHSDDRKYSYYIETSTDMKEWTRIVDHTARGCHHWQLLHFDALPVVFVKIVGTANTAPGCEWFDIVFFACPMEAG